ncbi:hypothetical protein AB6B38_10395 [Glycocaulis abyssi]|uniref:Uncharacterized protein n=1 Tax=Glycocaulis abyssi TaxID=1433403 RepID=A0ABV9NEX1_9PROT
MPSSKDLGAVDIKYDAKVAHVLDGDLDVVLNVGKEDGVSIGNIFVIFSLGGEILDPDSKESLGRLEIIKGRGRITHAQGKISTLRSSSVARQKRTVGSGLLSGLLTDNVEESIEIPFESPEIGDFAKKIG